jgi:hypothetical protein
VLIGEWRWGIGEWRGREAEEVENVEELKEVPERTCHRVTEAQSETAARRQRTAGALRHGPQLAVRHVTTDRACCREKCALTTASCRSKRRR